MENKDGSYKGISVFLLIFACVAIITTIYLAKQKTNNALTNSIGEVSSSNINLNEENVTEQEKRKFLLENLEGEYYTNNIEIKELRHQDGNFIVNNYSTLDVKEYDVTYFEIDGLKNESIENKINEEIKKVAFNMDETKDNGSFGKVVDYQIAANHSNILSFAIETIWYNDEENYWNQSRESKYFNYDLTTGEQIKLDQLFTSMYPVKQQINNEAEEEYLWHEPVTEWEYYPEGYVQYVNNKLNENYNEYLSWTDNSEDTENAVTEIENAVKAGKVMSLEEWTSWYYRSGREEKRLSVIQNFEKGNYEYLIEDEYIRIFVKDIIADIYLLPNIKYVTLYKLCNTDESIFTDEYNNAIKRQYKFYDETKRKYGYLTENIFLDESLYEKHFDNEELIINISEKRLNEKVTSMKEYLKDDIENMYIINVNSMVNHSVLFIIQIPKKGFESHKEFILNTLTNKFTQYNPVNETFWEFTELKNMGFEYKIHHDSMYVFEDGEYSDSYLSYRTGSDLSKELLNSDDLKYYDLNKLNEAYNEIFAYHGHDFKNENLRDYFLGKIWYKPIKGKVVSVDELSEIENQNRITIQNRINELKNQN